MDTTYPLAALDFTSAPSRQKPIIAMEGLLHVECDQWRLELTGFSQFITWPDWETWLSQTSALLGIDAPLGLPDAFLRHHGLTSYASCVQWLCHQTKREWLDSIKAFAECHPAGHKQPKRITDSLTKALSPLMAVRVPVARMAYEAITRLTHHGWLVIPQQSGFLVNTPHTARYVTEQYPALLARHLSQQPYKNENKADAQQTLIRQHLLTQLTPLLQTWGIHCPIPNPIYQATIDDYKGDTLDALLGLLLLAWSVKYPDKAFPADNHPQFEQIRCEGWIPNPISE